ncbi:fasciclin domain-containing protein, partial [Kribbella sp. NPDC051587]
MSKNIARIGIAAAALSLVLTMAACGSDDNKADTPAASQPTSAPTSAPSSEPSMDNASGLVGPGCEAYAKANPTGAGSVDGMAAAPVA